MAKIEIPCQCHHSLRLRVSKLILSVKDAVAKHQPKGRINMLNVYIFSLIAFDVWGLRGGTEKAGLTMPDYARNYTKDNAAAQLDFQLSTANAGAHLRTQTFIFHSS